MATMVTSVAGRLVFRAAGIRWESRLTDGQGKPVHTEELTRAVLESITVETYPEDVAVDVAVDVGPDGWVGPDWIREVYRDYNLDRGRAYHQNALYWLDSEVADRLGFPVDEDE